jgi:hypothetical protein
MRLTNAPTNALRTLQTPRQTVRQTTTQTIQTTHQTPYTHTPYNPQSVCAPLARAFYPPANTAALALRSRSQALDRTVPTSAMHRQTEIARLPTFTPSHRRVWNRPHHPITYVDIQHSTFCPIGSQPLPSLFGESRDSFAALGCSRTAGRAVPHQRPRQSFRQPILPTQCPHRWSACSANAAIAAFLPIGPLTDDHRKGVFARVSNHVFHSVGSVDAREPGATQALLKLKLRFLIGWSTNNPAGYAGTPLFLARGYFDLFLLHSAALLKILGGLGLEKLGWPVESAALTQRACGIRQIAWAPPGPKRTSGRF